VRGLVGRTRDAARCVRIAVAVGAMAVGAMAVGAIAIGFVLLVLPAASRATHGADPAVDRDVAAMLAARPLSLDGAALPADQLSRLYQGTGGHPLWLEGTALSPRGRAAVAAINGSLDDGLKPEKYYAGSIQSRISHLTAKAAAELDLLISAGMLGYVSDLSAGRLEPKASDPELFDYPNPPDPVPVVRRAYDSADFAAALVALAPPHSAYHGLRAALAQYRLLADRGGWPNFPAGGKLEAGDRGPRVEALRRRLSATGEAPPDPSDPLLFDDALDRAVRAFQGRHGLEVDGIVGERTLAALNTSIEARIRQIQMNMERWRWLPRDLGSRYLLVNAADFVLKVVEAGRVVLDMDVVVGRPYRRTPLFTGQLSYLVFNPDWNVPPSIARKDLLPKIRKDPGYLAAHDFQLLSDWSPEARELDPLQVDWSAVSGPFPYKLRQRPGPQNALGRIKFMLPNRYDVYLHDTPSQELFRKTVRSFSSGCVRVAEPIRLAEYLLSGTEGWESGRIRATLQSGITTQVNLPLPIPVYFTYFTAWVDSQGTLQFRDDIYRRDGALYNALIDQLVVETTGGRETTSD